MLELLLLRHGKSSWSNSNLADFDRPLSNRGVNASKNMGRYFLEQECLPDLILCSSSQRTRETFANIIPHLNQNMVCYFSDTLYESDYPSHFSLLKEIGLHYKRILLIGHNPTMTLLSLSLIRNEDKALSKVIDLKIKFPTGCCSIIQFPIENWEQLELGTGKFIDFVRP